MIWSLIFFKINSCTSFFKYFTIVIIICAYMSAMLGISMIITKLHNAHNVVISIGLCPECPAMSNLQHVHDVHNERLVYIILVFHDVLLDRIQ